MCTIIVILEKQSQELCHSYLAPKYEKDAASSWKPFALFFPKMVKICNTKINGNNFSNKDFC